MLPVLDVDWCGGLPGHRGEGLLSCSVEPPVDGVPVAVQGAVQRVGGVIQDASKFAQNAFVSYSHQGVQLNSQH